VTARVLGAAEHYFTSYQLTGPQPLSAHEQSAVLAELLRRPLVCRELSRQQAHMNYARRYSPALADALIASAERQLAGAKAQTTDTVERLTGRPPTTFAQWAAGHKDRFESARRGRVRESERTARSRVVPASSPAGREPGTPGRASRIPSAGRSFGTVGPKEDKTRHPR
jgi:hypothetical protein